MITLSEYNKAVDVLLKRYYPVAPTTHKDTFSMSHFEAYVSNTQRWIPFEIDVPTGRILDGKFAGQCIAKVKTHGHKSAMSWKNYVTMLVHFDNITWNPCTNEMTFRRLLRTFKYIAELNIDYFITDKPVKLHNVYMKVPLDYIPPAPRDPPFIGHDNHFLFAGFDFGEHNGPAIGRELRRLFQYRDDYKEIHFHLNNNGGGQITPCNMILLALCGAREPWMKKQESLELVDIANNRAVSEKRAWDPWELDNLFTSNNMKAMGLKLADLDNFQRITTRYHGKITIHMYPGNGSAAFFFITYIVYAFGKPRRFTQECYGKQLKMGHGDSNRLTLLGTSNTTSGDGNMTVVELKQGTPLRVGIPRQQFTSSTVLPMDWNRFWTEKKN